MNKEELLSRLNINYLGRDDVMRRVPLRFWNDGIWQELMARRRGTAKFLNLKAPGGGKFWYNQTEKMLDAGDRIFEYVIDSSYFDTRRMVLTDSVRNELIFTNYAEGVMMNMHDAANYLKDEREPQTTNELLLLNNNKAYSFMIVNLYNHYETTYLGGLAYLLLDGIVDLEHIYRSENRQDIPASQIGALNLKEETYSLPPAKDIPALMEEFCDFLNDEEVHPLIKAAAGQAWILAVRPYSDANERFARMLSTGILLRNGYDFFTGISISRMIFKEQYEYFKQMANIMKTENGGDLTYFIEYYIDLLARLVDEIKNPPGKGTDEPPVMGGNVNRQIETVQGSSEAGAQGGGAETQGNSGAEAQGSNGAGAQGNNIAKTQVVNEAGGQENRQETVQEHSEEGPQGGRGAETEKRGSGAGEMREGVHEKNELIADKNDPDAADEKTAKESEEDYPIYYSVMRRINNGESKLSVKDIQIETGKAEHKVRNVLIRMAKEGAIEYKNDIFTIDITFNKTRDELYEKLKYQLKHSETVTRKRTYEILTRMLSEGKQAFMCNEFKKELDCSENEFTNLLRSLSGCRLIRKFGNKESPIYSFCCRVKRETEHKEPQASRIKEENVENSIQELISFLQERGEMEFYRRDVIGLMGDNYNRCITSLLNMGMIIPNGNRGWKLAWKKDEKLDLASKIFNVFGEQHFSKNMVQNVLNLSEECVGQTLNEMHLLKIIGECEEDGEKWFHFLVNPAESLINVIEKVG